MQTSTLVNHKNEFRQHVLSTINQGIKHEDRFEDLSAEIVNTAANKLLLVDDYDLRKLQLISWMRQIEEAQTVRTFNMMFESPIYNKQFNAALNHLSSQFKQRFSRYM